MMEALARRGFDVEALTGAVSELRDGADFASHLAASGSPIEAHEADSWSTDPRGLWASTPEHYRVTCRGVPVTLYRTATSRALDDDLERQNFLRLFAATLARLRPHVLVNYGGDPLAHAMRSMARDEGATVVFALHNFNYPAIEPFTTVDAIIVPSRFAADHYRSTLGLECTVLPNLISLDRVRAVARDPRFITFVNPSYEKGVYAFARIADELGRGRPEIPLLVVEGRGSERTLADCGLDLKRHGNVFLMGHTPDPRRFWEVTRACVMPSVWWENQPLVAVEAMVNGIPVIGSDRGGLPETLGHSGVVLPLPEWLTPSTRQLPSPEEVTPWVEAIVRLWDDPDWYEELSRRSIAEAHRWAPEVLEPRYVVFFENVGRSEGRRNTPRSGIGKA
jgi:glycosyltransferase involved in cell wall biosynthesis